jgi:hypothetical protein
MIKKIIFLNIIIINLLFARTAMPAEFDELDKPPEGAHEGQMLLGAFFLFGWPSGSLIDSENDFVKGSYYTFSNDITKSLEVSHQAYILGLSFEYMPLSRIGAVAKFRRTYIMQNTKFGSEYQNWKGYLYSDWAFHIGPALHATTRKSWDFVFTPLIGYAFAQVDATPVAKKTLARDGYTGDTRRQSDGFSFGAQLNCTIYFTGGLFVSIGGEWIRNMIDLGGDYNLTNPQTGRKYSGNSQSALDIYSILISAGYAFSN